MSDNAMTSCRKISRYQLESGTSWFGDAFGKHSARSCRVGTRASILSFFSTRLYVACMHIRPLSRRLHTQRILVFMHEFPSN